MTTLKDLRKEASTIRKGMKEKGIPVMSCFNAGHSPESLRLNQRLFAIKQEMFTLEREGVV